MNLVHSLRSARFAWLLAGLIVLAWLIVAAMLDQSIFAVQKSRQLLEFGAVNGALLRPGDWWRLLVSQFLHSHFPHMLFNVLCVLAVGALIERSRGWLCLATVYVSGGAVGQVASVLTYPALVSSGASQALMALCGAALLLCRTRAAWFIIAAILAVQLALDLRAAQTVKAGHGWGFAAGILIGAAILVFQRIREAHLQHAPQPSRAARPDAG